MRATFSPALNLLLVICAHPLAAIAAEQTVAEPPPVKMATAVQLVERGAILAEDFSTETIDTKRWRIWIDDPGLATVRQAVGKLRLSAHGSVNMDGLSNNICAKDKDVVLVGEMDVRSQGGAPHHAVLHLCGCDGKHSPDNWTEIVLTDLGDKARFSVLTVTPEGMNTSQNKRHLDLPHSGEKGFLCRITLNGESNRADFSVKTPEGWSQICDSAELPLRTVHTELKFRGSETPATKSESETKSEAWFDNVRIYPRPQSHYVGIRLVGPSGEKIWSRKDGNGWPPTITDANGHKRGIQDLQIQLCTADGSTVVASQQSKNMGFYLLPLRDAPWDVYPVAAQVRVLLDGKILGKPLAIEHTGDGVSDGLYPDDVYNVTIE
jgi:hypothetical protein